MRRGIIMAIDPSHPLLCWPQARIGFVENTRALGLIVISRPITVHAYSHSFMMFYYIFLYTDWENKCEYLTIVFRAQRTCFESLVVQRIANTYKPIRSTMSILDDDELNDLMLK